MSKRRIGLETLNAGADPADIWGRPPPSFSGEQPDPSDGPAGVVATACLHRRTNATREAPAVVPCHQPDAREGQAGPFGVSERLVVPEKPCNHGGGKEPQFENDVSRGFKPGDWREPGTSSEGWEAARGVACQSEGIA